MVPDNTVNKGNIKRQKRMKKHPFCGAHFSINIWVFLPLHPAPFQKFSGPVVKIPMLTG